MAEHEKLQANPMNGSPIGDFQSETEIRRKNDSSSNSDMSSSQKMLAEEKQEHQELLHNAAYQVFFDETKSDVSPEMWAYWSSAGNIHKVIARRWDWLPTPRKMRYEELAAQNSQLASDPEAQVAKAVAEEEDKDDEKMRTKAELQEHNYDEGSKAGATNAGATVQAAIIMLPKTPPQAISAKKTVGTEKETPAVAAKTTPLDPAAAAATVSEPKPAGSTVGEGSTGLTASVRLLLEQYLRADLDEAAVPTAMGLIVDNLNDPAAVTQIFKGGGFEIVCGWLTRLVERPGTSSLEVAVAAPPFARALHAAANLGLVGPQRASAAGAPAALAGAAAATRAVTAAVPAALLPPALPGLLDTLALLLTAWPALAAPATAASQSGTPPHDASGAGGYSGGRSGGGGGSTAVEVLSADNALNFMSNILAKRTPGITMEHSAAEKMIACDDAVAATLVGKGAPEQVAGWLVGHCAKWATGQRAMRHNSVKVLSALLRALVRLRRAAGPQGLPTAVQAKASAAAAAALALEGRIGKAAAEAWETAKEAALALEPADQGQQVPQEEKNLKMPQQQQVLLAQGPHTMQARAQEEGEMATALEREVVAAETAAGEAKARAVVIKSTTSSELARPELMMASVEANKSKNSDAAAVVVTAAAAAPTATSSTASLKSPKHQRRKILSDKGRKVSNNQLLELVRLMRSSSNAREERIDALRDLWDHSDDEDAAFVLGKFVELGGLAPLALWLSEGLADLRATEFSKPAFKYVNRNVHVMNRLPIKSLVVITECNPQPVLLLKDLLEFCKLREDDAKWLELGRLCKTIRKRWKSLTKEASEGASREGAAPTLQRGVSSEDRIVDPPGMKKRGNGIPKEVQKRLREKEKEKKREMKAHVNPPIAKLKTFENIKEKDNSLTDCLEQLEHKEEDKQEKGKLNSLSKLIGASKGSVRKQGSLKPDYIRRFEEKKRSRLRLADPVVAGAAAGTAEDGIAVINNLAHVRTPRTEAKRPALEAELKRQQRAQCVRERVAKRARREEVVAVATKGEGEGALLSTSVPPQLAATEDAEVASLRSPKSPKSLKTPEMLLNAPEVKGFEEAKEVRNDPKVKFAENMMKIKIIKPEYQYYMEDPNYRGWMDHLGSAARIMAMQGRGEGALLKQAIALQLKEEEEEYTAMNEGDEGYAAFLLEKKRKERPTQQQQEAKYGPYPDNLEEVADRARPQLPPQAPLSDRSGKPPAPDGHLQHSNLPRGVLPPRSSYLPRGFSPGMLASSPPGPRGPRGPRFSPLTEARRGPRGAPARGSGGGQLSWSRMGRGPRGFPLQHQQLPRGAVPPSGGFVFQGGRGQGSGTLGGMVLRGGGRR